jgi:transcriptional regulator with XRE-family HTH domain
MCNKLHKIMETTENKTFGNRIKSLIDEYKMSIRQFEKECDINTGTLSKAIKDERAIGVDKINLILKRFPEVNAGWLISGQGDMFLNISHKKTSVNESGAHYMSTSKIMARIISTAVSDPMFEDDLLDALEETIKKRGLRKED